jgi:hypothetical protein
MIEKLRMRSMRSGEYGDPRFPGRKAVPPTPAATLLGHQGVAPAGIHPKQPSSNSRRSMRRPIRSHFLWLVYLAIGVIVAISKNYFDFYFPWRPIISAILAVLLWPLTLIGIDLHIH